MSRSNNRRNDGKWEGDGEMGIGQSSANARHSVLGGSDARCVANQLFLGSMTQLIHPNGSKLINHVNEYIFIFTILVNACC